MALFRNLSGIYIVPVHSIYWTSGVFHDNFITLPVENLGLPDIEYNAAHCSLWGSTLYFTGLKVTVVEPSFQYNISNATVDQILFLFLMPTTVQGWSEYMLNY